MEAEWKIMKFIELTDDVTGSIRHINPAHISSVGKAAYVSEETVPTEICLYGYCVYVRESVNQVIKALKP